MTVERLNESPGRARDLELREARMKVAQKVTDAIRAVADVLEVERERDHGHDVDIQSRIRREDADPDLIRGFLDTPVHKWVVSNYVTGSTDYDFLCTVVELLHELAPSYFRRPRY
jgi:hypothetical protein